MLKRFQASSVDAWTVAGAEIVVAFVVSTISALIMLVAAGLVYDFEGPASPVAVTGVFFFLTLGFAVFGVFLGAVLPTARAAQAVGMLVWFVMLFLGGAGPPPEVLTDNMSLVSDATPLWHTVRIIQDAWLGLDAGWSWVIFIGLVVLSAALAARFWRWE